MCQVPGAEQRSCYFHCLEACSAAEPTSSSPPEGRYCPSLAVLYKDWGGSLTGVWARLGANGQGRTSKPRSGVLGMLWGVRTQKLGAGFPMCHTSHWRLPHACGPQLSHLEKEVPFREDGLWPGVDGKHEALCTRGSAQPLAGSR